METFFIITLLVTAFTIYEVAGKSVDQRDTTKVTPLIGRVIRSTEDGTTSLHIAAQNGDVNGILHLLDNGTNIEIETNDKRTPLDLAAKFGQFNAVRILVERGANVNATDIQKRTPLHYTADGGLDILQSDSAKCAEFIIDHGAQINAKDEDGETPLHFAALNDKYDVAKVLVARGAEIDAVDDMRYTALDIATKNGHEYIVKLLTEGIDSSPPPASNCTTVFKHFEKNCFFNIAFIMLAAKQLL